MIADSLGDGLRRERKLPGSHLEEQDTERVNVAALIQVRHFAANRAWPLAVIGRDPMSPARKNAPSRRSPLST
jgi:hypothetical protein